MGKSAQGAKPFHYYLGAHLAICRGPVDAVTEIRAGDRQAWAGTIAGNGRLHLDKPELFGGDTGQGGLAGDVDIAFGGPDQPANDYLAAKLGAPQPAYRGVLSVILRQLYVSANNPYLQAWAVRVKRAPAKGWYDAKASIGEHANPAHILYELVTNEDWGLGARHQIDAAAFKAAADTLAAEGFGLSFLWTQAEPVEHLLQQVLDHIAAALYVDQATGRFTLKLIREDYVLDELPVFDESNVVALGSYQRRTLSETGNQITVTYTDPETGKARSVTVQDLANIQAQGAVVAETKQYPGIQAEALATRVATRDLTAASALLASVRLKVNRAGAALEPGDNFVLNWPPLGLEQLVLTVGEIVGGTLTDGTIEISAVENVFALAAESYLALEPAGWSAPERSPKPIAFGVLMEAPYRDLARRLPQSELDALAADAGYVQALAARPSDLSLDYELDTRTGALRFARAANGDFIASAVLGAAIGPGESAIELGPGLDLAAAEPGAIALIEAELVRLDAIDPAAATATIARGCADTVPAPHPPGARLWIYADTPAADPTEYTAGETVDAKLLTNATGGQLAAADAETQSVELDSRAIRPYPPGRVRVNGEAAPADIDGPLNLTWAHRDRLTQADQLIDTTAANIGPESGTTYTVRVYGEVGALIHTEAGLTGTRYTYPIATEIAEAGLERPNESLTLELSAQRDGYTSRQSQQRAIAECRGYGMFYGAYYGD